jgi:hypothetical protein
MRELLQAKSSKEFLRFARVGVRAFIAQRGSNRSSVSWQSWSMVVAVGEAS